MQFEYRHYNSRMRHQFIQTLTLPLTALAIFLSGCSTNQPHPAEEQLADCRAAYSDAQRENQRLVMKLGQVEKHLEECRLSAKEIISDIDAARLREEELRQLLKSELDDKSVEVEYLKGQLTVRMLDRILFQSGSAKILPEGKAVLDKLATALSSTKDIIKVVGHTDDVRISAALQRKYPSNWELSAARASSVVRYFQGEHGLDPTHMQAVGRSKYLPVTPNIDDQSRQRNRRVEVILTTRDK